MNTVAPGAETRASSGVVGHVDERGRCGRPAGCEGTDGRLTLPDLVPDEVIQSVPVDPDGPGAALGVEENAVALHRRDLPERPHRHARRFRQGALWVRTEGLNALEPVTGVQVRQHELHRGSLHPAARRS